jgi:hypothetical protein
LSPPIHDRAILFSSDIKFGRIQTNCWPSAGDCVFYLRAGIK